MVQNRSRCRASPSPSSKNRAVALFSGRNVNAVIFKTKSKKKKAPAKKAQAKKVAAKKTATAKATAKKASAKKARETIWSVRKGSDFKKMAKDVYLKHGSRLRRA